MDKEETLRAIEGGHIVEGLITFALYTGIKDISKLPGIWEQKISEQWVIKCNGHKKEINGIPPFSWLIEFNGFPAGIINAMGEGVLCGGELANEESLKEALIKFVTHG